MDPKLIFLILATLVVVMVTAKDDSDETNWLLKVRHIVLDVEKSLSSIIFEAKYMFTCKYSHLHHIFL